MSNIIEVCDVTFYYDNGEGEKTFALEEINLSVKKGEFCAVLGHNGSGKSTFAKHLNAIKLPCGGNVYVCTMNTKEHAFEIRACAGMVFQDPDNQAVAALVEDEVAFAPENLGVEPKEIRRRVDKALETVGMSEYAQRMAAGLSGGEKQRVAIAGALAQEPEIIILDEATSMLDPIGRREVMNTLLSANNENNMTIVHITHHMEEALQAKRVIVMDKGKILLDGTPKEVFSEVELLKSVGLDVPIMVQLSYELKKSGIDIPNDAWEEDEIISALVKLKNDKI